MKKIKYISIILFAILSCQIFITYTLLSYATVGDESIENYNNPPIGSNIDTNLKPIISAPIVDIDIPVRVSFDNTNVLSYSIETEGLTATEVTDSSMEFDVVATDEFGVLDLYATYEDNVVVKSSVYTYRANNKVYVSDISKDQAWYDWIEDLIHIGEVAIDTAQEWYYEQCGGYSEEYTPQTDELLSNNPLYGKTTIQGKLFWEEDSSTVAPLIKVKVQLIKKVDGITHIIASQYSEADGSFRFDINNEDWNDSGEDVFIRWWLEAQTFKVTNNWVFDHYCFQSPLRTDIGEGTVENFYYIIPEDEGLVHYKATYVHQAMTISERFAIQMGMSIPDYSSGTKTKLNVAHPSIFEKADNAYCFGNDFQSLACIGRNEWKNIDLITHEYGHYVQYLMNMYGANLLEILCNDPQHHPLADNFSDKWEKEYAMELTWTEAWASVFSTLSEHYYWHRTEREYGYFENSVMSDNSYLKSNLEIPDNSSYDHDENASTPSKDNRGESQEATVRAFLWDLYDEYSSSEEFDEINLGYRNWWIDTTQSGMYTLEDFTQYMEANNSHLRDKFGKILSHHRISPEIISVSDCSKTEPPTVTWKINGSEDHPNNRFKVLFYGVSNNLLGETEMITVNASHESSYSYQIPQSVWQSVLEELDYHCYEEYKIKILVAGYRYDFTYIGDSSRSLSGPYISAYMEKIIEVVHTFEYEQYDSTSHILTCLDCDEEAIISHDFEYSNITSTQHTQTCSSCGHTATHRHDMTFEKIDNTYHHKYCKECGYEKSREEHNYTYSYTPTFRNKHSKKCACGASVSEFCVGRAIIGGTSSKCMYCGQEIITIINPLSVDDDAILPNNKEDEEYQE